jgi:hypothetical protein
MYHGFSRFGYKAPGHICREYLSMVQVAYAKYCALLRCRKAVLTARD